MAMEPVRGAQQAEIGLEGALNRVGVGLRDERAAHDAARRIDEALRRQDPKRLSDGVPAHSEARSQTLLGGQLLTGVQRAADDQIADLVGDLAVRRLDLLHAVVEAGQALSSRRLCHSKPFPGFGHVDSRTDLNVGPILPRASSGGVYSAVGRGGGQRTGLFH